MLFRKYLLSGSSSSLPLSLPLSRAIILPFGRACPSPVTVTRVYTTQSFPLSLHNKLRENCISPPISIAMSTKSELSTKSDKPDTGNSCFFQCDIQTVFSGVMVNWLQLVNTAKFMNSTAGVLDIPLLATEQLPFVSEDKRTPLDLRPPNMTLFQKKKFSMCTDDTVEWLAQRSHIRNLYIYGIEAHICVLQTSLDLIRMKYNVYLVVDGVFSQRDTDRDIAIKRLQQAGVVLTSAESAIYEILGGADHAKFKACLPAVKTFGAFFKQESKTSHK